MDQTEIKEKPVLSEGPSEKGFYVGLYLEHLEEASFLYEQRLGLFDDPEIDWIDIGEFEERFEAHVDALVIGKNLAIDVCRMQADAGDFGELHTAVRVFLRQKQKEFVEEVLDELDMDDDDRVTAVIDALKYEFPDEWLDFLQEMLDSGDIHLIKIACSVIGFRRFPFGKALIDLCLQNQEAILPELVWALGRIGEPNAQGMLRLLIGHENERISFEAALSLLRMGDLRIADRLIQLAETKDWPIILISIAGKKEMSRTIHDIIEKRGATDEVLLALGFLGDVSSVPVLIDHLADESLAEKAAIALDLITGAHLFEDTLIPEEIDEDELFEDEKEKLKNREPLDDSDSPSGVVINLLSGNPDIWKKWWDENKSKYDPSDCHRNGKPFTDAVILENMLWEKSPHVVRKYAYENFIIKTGRKISFETDYLMTDQFKVLENI